MSMSNSIYKFSYALFVNIVFVCAFLSVPHLSLAQVTNIGTVQQTTPSPTFGTAAAQTQSQTSPTATANTAGSQDNSTAFVPLTSIPGLTSTANVGANSLPAFLGTLYKLCIGAAAVFTVIQIMRAGLRGITNNESVIAKSEARSMIQNAVIGLILVLSPYIVFSVIDLNADGTSPFLNFNFTKDLAGLQSTTTTQTISCTADNLAACTGTSAFGSAETNQANDPRLQSHVSTNSTYLTTLATNLANARKTQPTGALFLDIQSWGQDGVAACEQTKDTNGTACVAGQSSMIGFGESVPQKQYTCTCGK